MRGVRTDRCGTSRGGRDFSPADRDHPRAGSEDPASICHVRARLPAEPVAHPRREDDVGRRTPQPGFAAGPSQTITIGVAPDTSNKPGSPRTSRSAVALLRSRAASPAADFQYNSTVSSDLDGIARTRSSGMPGRTSVAISSDPTRRRAVDAPLVKRSTVAPAAPSADPCWRLSTPTPPGPCLMADRRAAVDGDPPGACWLGHNQIPAAVTTMRAAATASQRTPGNERRARADDGSAPGAGSIACPSDAPSLSLRSRSSPEASASPALRRSAPTRLRQVSNSDGYALTTEPVVVRSRWTGSASSRSHRWAVRDDVPRNAAISFQPRSGCSITDSPRAQ